MHLGVYTVVLCLLHLYHNAVTAQSVIPGYLDFDNLPETNFSCQKKVIGGYYADIETGCQMFHVCTIGQKGEVTDIKFLCLNGTVFDQATRVCERVDEVDCSKTEQYFDLNLELYGNNAFSFPNEEEESEISSNGDLESQKEPTTTPPPPTTTTPRPTEPPTTTPKPTTSAPSLHYLSVTTHRPYFNTQIKHNIRLTQQNQNRHQQNAPVTNINNYQTISSPLPTYRPSLYIPKSTTPKFNPNRYSSTEPSRITPLLPVRNTYDDRDHQPNDNSQFEDVDEYTSSGDGEYEEEEDEEPIVIHKPISVANRFPVTSIGNENIKVENNGDVNNNRPPNGHSSFTESLSLPHGNTNIRYNINRGNLHRNNNQNQYGGGYDSVQENTNIHAQHKINTDFILNRQQESERHKFHGGYNNNPGLNQFTFSTTTPVPFFNRPVQYSTTLQPYLLPPAIPSSTNAPRARHVGSLKLKLQEEIVSSQNLNHPFGRSINPLFTTPSIAIVSQTSSTSFVSSVSKATNPTVPSNGTILGISTLASVDGYPTQIVQQHNPHNLTLDLTQYVQQIAETTPPSSYDEYSESDVRKDPFFKDVPRTSAKKNNLGLRLKRGAMVLPDSAGTETLRDENMRIRRQLAAREPVVMSYRRGRQRVLSITPEEISRMTFSRPIPEHSGALPISGHSVSDNAGSEESEIRKVQNWEMGMAKEPIQHGGQIFSTDFKPDIRFSNGVHANNRQQHNPSKSPVTNSRNRHEQTLTSPPPTTQRSEVIDNPVIPSRTHQQVPQRPRVSHRVQLSPRPQTVTQLESRPQPQPPADNVTQKPTPQPTELTLDTPRGPIGRLGISSEAFGPMEIRNRQRPIAVRENRQRNLPRPLISREPIVIIGSVDTPMMQSHIDKPENLGNPPKNTQGTLGNLVPGTLPRRKLVSQTRKRLSESTPVADVGTRTILENVERVTTRRPLPRRTKVQRVESKILGGQPLILPNQKVVPQSLQNQEVLQTQLQLESGPSENQLTTAVPVEIHEVVVPTSQPQTRRLGGQRKYETRHNLNANSNRERASPAELEMKNRETETNVEIQRNSPRSNPRQLNREHTRNNQAHSRTPNREVIREEIIRSEKAIRKITDDLRNTPRNRKSSRRPVGGVADQTVASQMTSEYHVVPVAGNEDHPEEGTTREPLPETSFTCADKVPGGYYADLEADCQLFHICSQGRHGRIKDNKFLCGPGTRFNQQSLTCQTRELVDCQLSASLYHNNNHFSRPPQEAEVVPELGFEPHKVHRGKRSTIEVTKTSADTQGLESPLKRYRRQHRLAVVQRPQQEPLEYYDYEEEILPQKPPPPQASKPATSSRVEPTVFEYYDDYVDTTTAPTRSGHNTKHNVPGNKIPPINNQAVAARKEYAPLQTKQSTPVKQGSPSFEYYDEIDEPIASATPRADNAKLNVPNNISPNVNSALVTPQQYPGVSTKEQRIPKQEAPQFEYYDDYPDATLPSRQAHNKQFVASEVPIVNNPVVTTVENRSTQSKNHVTPVSVISPQVVVDYYDDYFDTTTKGHNNNDVATDGIRTDSEPVVTIVSKLATKVGQETKGKLESPLVGDVDDFLDKTAIPSRSEQNVTHFEESYNIPQANRTSTSTEKQSVSTETVSKGPQTVSAVSQLDIEYYDDYIDTTTASVKHQNINIKNPDIKTVEPVTAQTDKQARPVKLISTPTEYYDDYEEITAKKELDVETRPTSTNPTTKTAHRHSAPTPKLTTQGQRVTTKVKYSDDFLDTTTHATRQIQRNKISSTKKDVTTTQQNPTSTLGQDYYLSNDYVNDNYEPDTYIEKGFAAENKNTVSPKKEKIPSKNLTLSQNNDETTAKNVFTKPPVVSKSTQLYDYYDDELTTGSPRREPIVEPQYFKRINIDDIYFTTTYDDLLTTDQFSTTDSSVTEVDSTSSDYGVDPYKLTTVRRKENKTLGGDMVATKEKDEETLNKLRDAVYTFLVNEEESDKTTASLDSETILTTLNTVPETTVVTDRTTESAKVEIATTTTSTTSKPTTVKSRRISNRYRGRFTSTARPTSATHPTTIQSLYERSKARRVVQSRHSTPTPLNVLIRTAGSMTRKPPKSRTRVPNKRITEEILETTQPSILTTNIIEGLSDVPNLKVKNGFDNDVNIVHENVEVSTISPEIPEYSTEQSVPLKYSKSSDISKDTDVSLKQEVPILRVDTLERPSSKEERINDGRLFDCKGKELFRFYADSHDARLFHYCSTGFHNKQTLDFKFICDNGTRFNADLQKCE